MKQIYKYEIKPQTEQIIMLPGGSTIRHVGAQFDKLYLWAEVNTIHPEEPRKILVYGTGHDMKDVPSIYIGTADMGGGALVWHVYESLEDYCKIMNTAQELVEKAAKKVDTAKEMGKQKKQDLKNELHTLFLKGEFEDVIKAARKILK